MKMSNVQVSRMVGLSPATVSRLRSGERGPTLDNMRTVAKVFDWPVAKQVESEENGAWAEAWEAAMVEWRDLEELVDATD